MNQKELLLLGETKLKQENIQEPKEKARRLLEFILKQSRAQCISNMQEQVESKKQLLYQEKIQELIQGKPLQYITNHQGFMGLDFYVDENVLIPQPDTEILVEEAIKKINEIKKVKNIKVLDLCTGSGAIAVSIKKYADNSKKNVEVYASDISENAIKIANKNAKRNNVKINFILSDMFKKIKEKDFDIILSNPPYIETTTIDTLSKEVQNEPYIALNGGEDGLEFYRIIAKNGYNYLTKNGSILLEIGYNQKEKVIQIFDDTKKYSEIKNKKDLSGNDRLIEIDVN